MLIVQMGFALTLGIAGDDSWFESPVPERVTVLLIGAGLGAAALACAGVLWLGSSALPEDEQAQLRDHWLF
jgi:hypothetical protein